MIKRDTRYLQHLQIDRLVTVNVSSIDSAGLGELIGSYTSLTNQGGKMKLLNLQKQVNSVLQITKICTIFETYENEAIAVLSLQ